MCMISAYMHSMNIWMTSQCAPWKRIQFLSVWQSLLSQNDWIGNISYFVYLVGIRSTAYAGNVEVMEGAVHVHGHGIHSHGGGVHTYGIANGIHVHGPNGVLSITSDSITVPTGFGFDLELKSLTLIAVTLACASIMLNVVLGATLLYTWFNSKGPQRAQRSRLVQRWHRV